MFESGTRQALLLSSLVSSSKLFGFTDAAQLSKLTLATCPEIGIRRVTREVLRYFWFVFRIETSVP